MLLTSVLSNWRLSFSSPNFLQKVENNNILSYVYIHPSCNKQIYNITIALQYSPYKIGRYPVFPTTKKLFNCNPFFFFFFCVIYCPKGLVILKSHRFEAGVGLYTHALMKFCMSLNFMHRLFFFQNIPIEVNEVIAIYKKKICKRPKVFWHICKCQFTGDCNKCVFIQET